MIRRLACLCALLVEPCVHVVAVLTGVAIPHPEGIGALVATHLANNPDV